MFYLENEVDKNNNFTLISLYIKGFIYLTVKYLLLFQRYNKNIIIKNGSTFIIC